MPCSTRLALCTGEPLDTPRRGLGRFGHWVSMAEVVLFAYSTSVVRRFGPTLLVLIGGVAAVLRWDRDVAGPRAVIVDPVTDAACADLRRPRISAPFTSSPVPYLRVQPAPPKHSMELWRLV